jgi:hypothetical protein
MKDEKVIAPPASIDSVATLGIDHEYYDAETKVKVNKSAIEAAIGLGLSIEPKYIKESTSRLRLKIHYNDLEFTRETFNAFVSLFDLLTGKIKVIEPKQVKLMDKLSYHVKVNVTKKFKNEEIPVTFPNGQVGIITAKMAKLLTIAPIIPEEYYEVTVALAQISSYSVKYNPNNKTIKVGCNSIKAVDLYSYFEHISQSWDLLDLQIKQNIL